MRLSRAALCLPLGLMLLFLPPVPVPDAASGERPTFPLRPGQKTPVPIPEDERQLQKDVQARNAAAVLDFFRKRTPSADEAARLRGLIRQLGDDSSEARDRALYALMARGRSVAG